jgi:mannose-1-phosphate guanylyltransferase/phosphomannomutase
VTLRFLDADGTDVDEVAQRKIERFFYRQDFRRAFAADIGDISYPARALEHYSAAMLASVDADLIPVAGFQLVLDYAYGSTSLVMPNVLSKLGADVLSVNPYAFTAGAAVFEPKVHAARVSELVRSAGANLGAVIDPDGERLTLIDDEGHVLSDDQTLLVMVTLVAGQHDDAGGARARIALPVSVSGEAERIAAAAGAEIVWTKVSASHIMDVAESTPGIVLAASQDGGYIFPGFLPAYDATAALVHLLEMLARSGLRLSKLVAGLPRLHMAHESVVTPWEQKGLVMRRVVEAIKDEEVVLVDGVKIIHQDGWALVLPDPDEPVTHVWAEGPSDADARKRAQDYARQIRQLLR